MKNRELLPFERNRYYTGKMLTSADFRAEQEYMNNKRRFINSVMFGAGIAKGLRVSAADLYSVEIEKGMAVDGTGRELVIVDDCIKKLSSIEGYEDTASDRVYLYLEYAEENIQPVYAASAGTSENEFNRTAEKCRIYLSDEAPQDYSDTGLLLKETVIAETELFRFSFVMPEYVSADTRVRAEFIIECRDTDMCNGVELEYSGSLQFPSFLSDSDRHDELINIRQLLRRCEVYKKAIWLYVPDMHESISNVLLKASLAKCTEDKRNVQTADVIYDIKVYRKNTRKMVDDILARAGRYMQYPDNVCIASIKIARKEKGCEILSITNEGYCLELPSDGGVRAEILDYYRDGRWLDSRRDNSADGKGNEVRAEYSKAANMTTGVAEIVIGGRLKKGEIRYSDEISHGLGLGSVYISLGKITPESDQRHETVILGAQGIFDNEPDDVEYAVKLINGKGNFVIGIRAKKDINCLIYKMRWYAADFNVEIRNRDIPFNADKRIVVETPSLVVAPGEECFFNVHYNNMEPCRLGYELTQRGTGYISEEGVYTAPEREGVYEIRIFSINDPSISTYAYAIVKRK